MIAINNPITKPGTNLVIAAAIQPSYLLSSMCRRYMGVGIMDALVDNGDDSDLMATPRRDPHHEL